MLRLLLGVTVLLLLLCPQAARSDCSLPPDVPNAQPDLEGRTSFPEGSTVTYKCNKDFVKVPGKIAAISCLKDNEWSPIAEFCNRSCDVPTRLLFAVLKQPYNQQNYFPAGSVVEYECRRSYKRNHSLSGKVICLQNFTWSKPDEFCEKKSCPNPGEVINGYVNITTDILFGASIIFSCKTGYKLVGATSSYCILMGNTVDWSDPLPECKESSQISKVTPTPQKPTTVNIPATEVPSASQKHTTVNIPGTEALSTPQKSTTVNIPATEVPSAPQKPITVNASATKTPLIPQKLTTVNVAATEASSTPWKTITANDSATIAKISPVSNVLSAETPPKSQTHIIANICATQVTVTQKFTAVHDSVTKGLCTTQRLTSACFTATQSPAVTMGTPISFYSRTLPVDAGTIALILLTIVVGIAVICTCLYKCLCREKKGFPAYRPKMRVSRAPRKAPPHRLASPFSSWSFAGILLVALVLQLPASSDACGDPPRFGSMMLKGLPKTLYLPGDRIEFKCRLGYKPVVPPLTTSTVCQPDNTWAPLQEACTRKLCPQLGEPQNGQIIYINGTFQFGSQAQYVCNEGYYLIGTKSIYCELFGNTVDWSDSPPQCEKVLCQPPGKISNGKYTNSHKDIFEYNEVVTYRCNPSNGPDEYSLVGESRLVCSGHNAWSSDPPECKVVKCEYPVLENGIVVSGFGRKYYYKAQVVFECLEGFHLKGSSTVFCGADSTWEPEIPECVKGFKTSRTTKPPVSSYIGHPTPSDVSPSKHVEDLGGGIIVVIVATLLALQ